MDMLKHFIQPIFLISAMISDLIATGSFCQLTRSTWILAWVYIIGSLAINADFVHKTCAGFVKLVLSPVLIFVKTKQQLKMALCWSQCHQVPHRLILCPLTVPLQGISVVPESTSLPPHTFIPLVDDLPILLALNWVLGGCRLCLDLLKLLHLPRQQ